MYTGTADHALTAELVSLVDVPVIASGDVTSRARAEALLHTTGCAALMVGRAAQGNPWLLADLAGRGEQEPTADEVASELVRFVRETVRELGEYRGIPFLRKFHGWYVRQHGGFPRSLRQALAEAGSAEEIEEALYAVAPGARARVAAMEGELAALGSVDDDVELQLPISIYGGG
jgi:tRNA-dihydrouridine synthase B